MNPTLIQIERDEARLEQLARPPPIPNLWIDFLREHRGEPISIGLKDGTRLEGILIGSHFALLVCVRKWNPHEKIPPTSLIIRNGSIAFIGVKT